MFTDRLFIPKAYSNQKNSSDRFLAELALPC